MRTGPFISRLDLPVLQDVVDARERLLFLVESVESLEQVLPVLHERRADEDAFFFFQHRDNLVKHLEKVVTSCGVCP